jgi:nucleoside-diphosphate-sugar epimerase
MRVYITGGSGFIAKNLRVVLQSRGHQVFDDSELFRGHEYRSYPKTGEACVHRNDEILWESVFKENAIDVVVHNAAVVGTDVVALNPQEAVLSNVHGTYNIVRAANKSGVGVCYLGTTVIYDTPNYQDEVITENSVKNPLTYYGVQKLGGEQIVTSMAKKWAVVRPLFAFGGLGDMNSLIAKTLFAGFNGKNSIDMFLDPLKVKDYLHVTDFCKAVETVCVSGWGEDWNVSAETPMPAGQIVTTMSDIMKTDLDSIVKWYAQTDYLGNHRLSSDKIRKHLGWKPQMSLEDGIKATADWIHHVSAPGTSGGGYNPLKFLEEAKSKGTDLLEHFPSK